jgi:hypothetical protein
MNRKGGKGVGFKRGCKDRSSLSSLGNRMLNGNASKLALHCMYSGMPERDLKELQKGEGEFGVDYK